MGWIPTVQFHRHKHFGARWLGLLLPRDLRRLLLQALMYSRIAIQAAHGGEVVFSDTCYTTHCAEFGHLSLLQWAREYADQRSLREGTCGGAPWDWRTCAWAARNGDLHMLKWARANGAPWNGSVCYYATCHKHFDIQRWAYANDAPIDVDVYIYGHEDEWELDNGCP